MTQDNTADLDQASNMLEEARNTVESAFYRVRDEVLDADQLFEIRIALQDACDTIMLSTRHIERAQRAVEPGEPELA
jgi:hypothetical protein